MEGAWLRIVATLSVERKFPDRETAAPGGREGRNEKKEGLGKMWRPSLETSIPENGATRLRRPISAVHRESSSADVMPRTDREHPVAGIAQAGVSSRSVQRAHRADADLLQR